ncbi:hypothetical protein HUJ05_000915 [Dendroctonus ponderosae]|nr:hypothetical protein HUJ05_000915 [Dendroctonus ponderosae]
MFADLQTGLADISGNTAAINEERLHYFRFLPQTGIVNLNRLKWFFVAPPLSSTENIWLLPFVTNVWVLVTFVMIVWYLVLAVVINFEMKLRNMGSINERSCFVAAIDLLVTSFTQRGVYKIFE